MRMLAFFLLFWADKAAEWGLYYGFSNFNFLFMAGEARAYCYFSSAVSVIPKGGSMKLLAGFVRKSLGLGREDD